MPALYLWPRIEAPVFPFRPRFFERNLESRWAAALPTVELAMQLKQTPPYPVSGRSLEEVRRNAMVLARTQFYSVKGYVDGCVGFTSYQVRPDIKYLRSALQAGQMSGVVERIVLTVSMAVILPEWTDASAATEAERTSWQASLLKLESHEQEHVAMLKRQMLRLRHEMESVLRRWQREERVFIVRANEEDKAEERLDAQVREAVLKELRPRVERMDREHARFDKETGHGALVVP